MTLTVEQPSRIKVLPAPLNLGIGKTKSLLLVGTNPRPLYGRRRVHKFRMKSEYYGSSNTVCAWPNMIRPLPARLQSQDIQLQVRLFGNSTPS